MVSSVLTLVYATRKKFVMNHVAPPHWYIPAASWSTRVPAHNPRYSGRPSNPFPFPRQRSCLSSARTGMTPRRTGHRVRFANDPASQRHNNLQDMSGHYGLPYNRDRPFQAGQQPSTAGSLEPNVGGVFDARTNLRRSAAGPVATGTPPFRGVFEARTEERHNKENTNTGFPFGHNTHSTFNRSTPRPRTSGFAPHPFLAPPSLPLIYDLRLPPSTISFPPTSPFTQYQYHQLAVPMHSGMPRRVRLIGEDFPWSFDLNCGYRRAGYSEQTTTSMDIEGWFAGDPTVITCLDVLSSLYAALQKPLADVEWGSADDRRRASILRARERRLRLVPTTHSQHRTTTARSNRILRVDWLGSKIVFGGLARDEAFARRRLLPGSEEPPETWVVKFRKL